MKIAILGAGAMGTLFGGYLSKHNEVWLVDIEKEKIEGIKKQGVKIKEKDSEDTYYPNATYDTSSLEKMDLVIVFVKAMHTKEALSQNINLIGDNTYLMTLQNGMGHEDILLNFVDKEHVIIGSTQHNSSFITPGFIHHGGGGMTSIGLLSGNNKCIQEIADNFTKCGIKTVVSENISKNIWEKLFLNTSVSVLTAILQVRMGFIRDNQHAWFIANKLIQEAVMVANMEGFDFRQEEIVSNIEKIVNGAKEGYTSIYADVRDGVRSEVDTISGAVIKAASQLGLQVPYHEFAVRLVHALEDIRRGSINRGIII